MTIREALEILDVDRVRSAMAAFEADCVDPQGETWNVCFLAMAYGSRGRLLQAMLAIEPRVGECGGEHAAAVLGVEDDVVDTLTLAFDEAPYLLQSEATAWLAEHGNALEPSPAQVHA
jgi:hypothetical protein